MEIKDIRDCIGKKIKDIKIKQSEEDGLYRILRMEFETGESIEFMELKWQKK